MAKPHITNAKTDDIRFNRIPKSQRQYVKLTVSMTKKLLVLDKKLNAMYDAFLQDNRADDNPRLRDEAIQYMIDNSFIYRGSHEAYVINPWLSMTAKPMIYRILKRAINPKGQLA